MNERNLLVILLIWLVGFIIATRRRYVLPYVTLWTIILIIYGVQNDVVSSSLVTNPVQGNAAGK